MKKIAFAKWVILIVIVISHLSCKKNHTVFFEDDDAPYLSVFSDKGNNIMTCYINEKVFRTQDRITGVLFGHSDYDLYLYKDNSAIDSDILIVTWYADQLSSFSTVTLALSVKKGFSYYDFNAFEGKRMVLDGINGYFMVNDNRLEKGTGNIYFRRAFLIDNDSTDITRFSGIFEATLPSYKITRGRFDHTLADGVVAF
jgi:hypothetical protein